jgi:hypothetical protein
MHNKTSRGLRENSRVENACPERSWVSAATRCGDLRRRRAALIAAAVVPDVVPDPGARLPRDCY